MRQLLGQPWIFDLNSHVDSLSLFRTQYLDLEATMIRPLKLSIQVLNLLTFHSLQTMIYMLWKNLTRCKDDVALATICLSESVNHDLINDRLTTTQGPQLKIIRALAPSDL